MAGSGQRWLILAALTLARATMGVQFQSVAAAGPAMTADLALSYAALGTLMGVYLLPGVAVALPGGWLARHVGDKRLVLIGLAMMAAGGALMGVSGDYAVVLVGRAVSGAGAVLLNVLVTKMVTDWFAERGLVTAMGVLLTSWPLGLGLALVLLGPLAAAAGWPAAMLVPAVLSVAALLCVWVVYRHPPQTAHAAPAATGLTRRELVGASLAGMVWTFYNLAFILLLGFGPTYLVAAGRDVAAAGAITSLASWLIIPALALGGWLAERIGRPTATMATTFVLIAALTAAIPHVAAAPVLFAAIGLVFGPAGALVMALPAEVARPQSRAVAMGVYFTWYYVGMGLGRGWPASAATSPAIPPRRCTSRPRPPSSRWSPSSRSGGTRAVGGEAAYAVPKVSVVKR